jgi:hypothetical protein
MLIFVSNFLEPGFFVGALFNSKKTEKIFFNVQLHLYVFIAITMPQKLSAYPD